MPFFKLIVPTVDTVRYQYLVTALVRSFNPVMVVGPVGTGKTSMVENTLTKLDPKVYSFLTVNMSAQVRLHVSSRTSTCQIRRHVKYVDMSAQERQQVRYTNMSCTSMSDQVHQHVCLGMSTCLLWYVKCSLRYVPVQVHIKGFITK